MGSAMTDGIPRGAQSPTDVRPSWSRSRGPVARRIVQPLQSFLETETSSAILVLAAVGVALLWANGPYAGSYDRFWTTELVVRVGDRALSYDLRGGVSDVLMTLFFLVVGLEIKRELLTGELRESRAALLPVAAALGGMLVPALLYLAFTAGTPAASGFGIAMPTDVVFALSVLALASPLPPGLKALLLTLAIVDDLASIVVVAFTYSRSVDVVPLSVALVVLAIYWLLWRIDVRAIVVYLGLGLVVWTALAQAGVSPTLAGVALAFLTPAVAFQRPRAVSEEAHRVADHTVDDPVPPDADAAHWLYLATLSKEAVSPLARAEAVLLPWASYVVVPLFVLAFAGIDLSRSTLIDAVTSRVGVAILVSRVVGKPLGIVLAGTAAMWVGARLPPDVRRRHLLGLGVVAGIPFTVSLYIAEVSLPVALIPTATASIIVAAAVAGALGLVVLSARARR